MYVTCCMLPVITHVVLQLYVNSELTIKIGTTIVKQKLFGINRKQQCRFDL